MARTYKSLFLIVAILALPTCLAFATPINYGDFSDIPPGSVMYLDVTESSGTDPGPLYGAPTVIGNELRFPTTGSFTASSLDGGPSDQTDGRLSFMIAAQSGHFLTNFSIQESGLVALNAPFGGDAFAEVIGFGVIEVVEIGGASVNLPNINFFMSATPLGGQYQLSVIGTPSYSTGWQASALVGLPQNTTKINVTIDNNLFASTSGQGTRSFIDKKAFRIDIDTEVPEPGTMLLGLASLLAVTTMRRQAFA